jgi:hypothetical protein
MAIPAIPALVKLGLKEIRTVEKPTACVNCDEFKKQKCACGGPHPLKIVGEGVGPIQSYTGELPSPFSVVYKNEWFRYVITDSEIRGWVKDAANYHEVPYEMLAVILQQENSPNASTWLKFLQFGERSVTTIVAIAESYTGIFARLDEAGFRFIDEKGKKRKPSDIPNASTGIINMRRPTLLKTISQIPPAKPVAWLVSASKAPMKP